MGTKAEKEGDMSDAELVFAVGKDINLDARKALFLGSEQGLTRFFVIVMRMAAGKRCLGLKAEGQQEK